jgi:hypothetical protein
VVAASGYFYLIAGGAPIYISNWNNIGGQQSGVHISPSAIANADQPAPWNHLHQQPVDGTLIRGYTTGNQYQTLGGAPYATTADGAYTDVDQNAIDNAGQPGVWSHLAAPSP